MAKIPYSKSPLTLAQQLQQLKNRGLAIANEPKALHLLENVSYYRLSGYWYPLLDDKVSHTFKSNATFETAFKLYCFDRELRQLILSELEKIEVAIRSKMIYLLSHKYGAMWFQNPAIFSNANRHASLLGTFQKEFFRSDEQFIKAFKDRKSVV